MPQAYVIQPASPRQLKSELRSAMVDIQSALDLESFWKACLKLVGTSLPHCACSLFFNIVDFEKMDARHHVSMPRNPNYVPATSLTISGPFLARHPQIKMYTYSQIASEDTDAPRRRLVQEPEPEWNEFIHLAFWHEAAPDAVLSIHRPPERSVVTDEERAFLEQLYPVIEAGLRRLRGVENLNTRQHLYEHFLRHVPLSVLFVDGDNHLLFATTEADKKCALWNRSLRNLNLAAAEFELPRNVGRLFHQHGGDAGAAQGFGKPSSVSLQHPSLNGLAARIERSWHFPGLQLRPCYVVTFVESASLKEQSGEISEAALLVLQQLTLSERRVAQLVAKGLRNGEIADKLCRSHRTVEFQLNSIYRKLGISSRTQLVRALT
jgi:DNA-binding CsgD family transcriptional regulator